ncbi:hypothetical protein CVT25_007003 [Psilocybe cyanescens]|uniref:Uncharacterized protein n=1 Tax=Psilocybe cyanescens TaxID=93625 RepID=A0A409WYC0_PSICY|nr:hypothetical protein CVT25_007003 [Psilocybe cyanescens]
MTQHSASSLNTSRLSYTVRVELEDVDVGNVVVTSPPLLLADKINAYASRVQSLDGKAQIDLEDIKWCIEEMHA